MTAPFQPSAPIEFPNLIIGADFSPYEKGSIVLVYNFGLNPPLPPTGLRKK